MSKIEKLHDKFYRKAEAAMLIAQMTKSNSMLPPLWTPDSIIEEQNKEDH